MRERQSDPARGGSPHTPEIPKARIGRAPPLPSPPLSLIGSPHLTGHLDHLLGFLDPPLLRLFSLSSQISLSLVSCGVLIPMIPKALKFLLGLPGKAFSRRRHVWLTGANEADSKVFSRAILAKSACIQTVVCIPLMDGVLELGTTERVEEDMEMIQHAKSFFTDHQGHCPKPALSEHSTSNFVSPIDLHHFHSQPVSIPQPMSINPRGSNQEDQEDDDDDDEDDGDGDEEDNEDNDDEETEEGSDSEAEIERSSAQMMLPSVTAMEVAVPTSEPSELMQIEMSEGIRPCSPDDCSNNFDSEFQMLIGGHTSSRQSDHQPHQEDSYQAWHLLHEDICSGFPQSSGATQIHELSQEDAHYSETVSAVLNNSSSCWADLSSITHLAHSRQSAFCKWTYGDHALPISSKGTSQWLLKYILLGVPNLHCKDKDGNSPKSRDGEGGIRFRKGTPQEELSANHVLAERRRREKLNERFIILRSLVPFVTKMDKASILGDTIEYLKQLRKRIQGLESGNGLMESGSDHRKSKPIEINNKNSRDQSSTQTDSGSPRAGRNIVPFLDKRKLRVLECSKGAGNSTSIKAVDASITNLQVSIIETDALLELQCPYRDGLLLKIMQSLDELRLEITSIQYSSAESIFVAELRAKVKEIHGKKASIVQVKKAIHQILTHC